MNKLFYSTLKTTISIFAFLFISQNGFSQDFITYQSGERLKAHVIEITAEDVAFKPINNQDTVIIIDKAQVLYIQYENGRIEDFGGRNFSAKPIIERKIPYNQEISFDAIALFINHFELHYERRLSDKLGIEIGGGIIGVGSVHTLRLRDYSNVEFIKGPSGELEKYGAERFTSRENGFIARVGLKITPFRQNSLEGLYVKPEFIFSQKEAYGSSFHRDPNNNYADHDFSWEFQGSSMGLLVKAGYQKVFAKRFTFDINAGFGLVKDLSELKVEGDYNEYVIPYRYSNYRYRDQYYNHLKTRGGIALDGEVALGFLF